jgi:TPR repeat protein
MLNGVGPSVALGRDTKLLKEILDRTAERVGKDLTNRPEVEAELRGTLGNVYYDLGDSQQAEAMHRKALELKRKLNDQGGAARELHSLGTALWRQQTPEKLAEAEEINREALALRRKLYGEKHPDVADSRAALALVYYSQGKLAEAEAMFRDAWDIQGKALDKKHSYYAWTLNSLAMTLNAERKYAEAELLFRETIGIWKKYLGNEVPNLGISFDLMGVAQQRQGKLVEAEASLREAVRIQRKVLSAQHPNFLISLDDLASVCRQQGKMAEALALWREGAEQGDLTAQTYLARIYATGEGVAKDETEAVKWYRKAAERGHGAAQLNLGLMYNQGLGIEKNEAEGAKWIQKAMANRNPMTLNDLAWVLATSPHEVWRNGTNAVAFAEKAVAATSRTNAEYLDTLAAAYAETGDFPKAISTQKEAIAQIPVGQLKSDFESRLKLYEARTPYRE